MRRSVFAALLLLAPGVTVASADGANPDRSTWRWVTSMALDAQRPPYRSTLARENEFIQRYERYSFNGRIDASH